MAKKHLQYVYLGNITDKKRSSTYCPKCSKLIIAREHYDTTADGINPDKSCKFCGTQINIIL